MFAKYEEKNSARTLTVNADGEHFFVAFFENATEQKKSLHSNL